MLNFEHQSNDCQVSNPKDFIYINFATIPTQSFIGVSVQKQKLYVVHKKSICVFEYFGGFKNMQTQRAPVLIKQILLPFQILKCIITDKYICIKSRNWTQIRDNEFQSVYFSEGVGVQIKKPKNSYENTCEQQDSSFDTVEEEQLQCQIENDDVISWKMVTKKKNLLMNSSMHFIEYWAQKYNIISKKKLMIKFKSKNMHQNNLFNMCKKQEQLPRPLFINQLGYMQNFYLWLTNNQQIQYGIYFPYKEHDNYTQNYLYEISSFQLKKTNIKKIFPYNFTNINLLNQPNPESHLFIAVCSSLQNIFKGTLINTIFVFEIISEQNLQQGKDLNGMLNDYLLQFNKLRQENRIEPNLSDKNLLSKHSNSESNSSVSINSNNSTKIIESFTLKSSFSILKIFFSQQTNILWISDSSQFVQKIKFLDSGDLKLIKEGNLSLIESLESLNNKMRSELVGVMYDRFPIFKANAFNLQIGCQINLRQTSPAQSHQTDKIQSRQNKNCEDEKAFIEFEVQQLQKVDLPSCREEDQYQQKSQAAVEENQRIQMQSIEVQTNQINQQLSEIIQQNILVNQDTQTQNEQLNHQLFHDLPKMFKQLNFQKVEQLLLRFSQIFSGLATKNVNKIKDFNSKIKEEIKLKINTEIFELINEVFSSLINEALSQKIQKQVSKARQLVEKIFNQNIHHFHLMLIDQRSKQQSIKKSILQQQLKSIDMIKEASIRFLDVTKIREMQKIACNEAITESIKGLSQKIQTLQISLDKISKESEEIQNKIIEQIKQIKESFTLLIQLEEDDSRKAESEKIDENQCEESGSESQHDDEDHQLDQRERQGLDDQRIFGRLGVDFSQPLLFLNPHENFPNERRFDWNPLYVGPPYQSVGPPYQSPSYQPNSTYYLGKSYPNYHSASNYPPPPPPPPLQPYHPTIHHSYQTQKNPYPSNLSFYQQPRYLPPHTHSQIQIRKCNQKILKQQKSKKRKSAKKPPQLQKKNE